MLTDGKPALKADLFGKVEKWDDEVYMKNVLTVVIPGICTTLCPVVLHTTIGLLILAPIQISKIINKMLLNM